MKFGTSEASGAMMSMTGALLTDPNAAILAKLPWPRLSKPTVTFTSAANDAALVDLELAVTGLHVETNATARRIPCRLVSRHA